MVTEVYWKIQMMGFDPVWPESWADIDENAYDSEYEAIEAAHDHAETRGFDEAGEDYRLVMVSQMTYQPAAFLPRSKLVSHT